MHWTVYVRPVHFTVCKLQYLKKWKHLIQWLTHRRCLINDWDCICCVWQGFVAQNRELVGEAREQAEFLVVTGWRGILQRMITLNWGQRQTSPQRRRWRSGLGGRTGQSTREESFMEGVASSAQAPGEPVRHNWACLLSGGLHFMSLCLLDWPLPHLHPVPKQWPEKEEHSQVQAER